MGADAHDGTQLHTPRGLAAWFQATMATTKSAAQPPTFLKMQLDSRFRSEGAAIGDFNHDGTPDIAAGNVWYQAPTWQIQAMRGTPIEFDPLSYSDSFANFVDDINGDGWDDLIVVGFPGAPTNWYENPKNSGWTVDGSPSRCRHQQRKSERTSTSTANGRRS